MHPAAPTEPLPGWKLKTHPAPALLLTVATHKHKAQARPHPLSGFWRAQLHIVFLLCKCFLPQKTIIVRVNLLNQIHIPWCATLSWRPFTGLLVKQWGCFLLSLNILYTEWWNATKWWFWLRYTEGWSVPSCFLLKILLSLQLNKPSIWISWKMHNQKRTCFH